MAGVRSKEQPDENQKEACAVPSREGSSSATQSFAPHDYPARSFRSIIPPAMLETAGIILNIRLERC
ncbi:MAG: hypothetical protein JO069_04180 [Verrucomicrobia bacterium]|nr:hypothetical protein [Verrucomicrobiota bacterium]